MLILLPPSEGKTPPTSGDPVDLGALSHPELRDARREVGEALRLASGKDDALDALGVGASLAADVAANTRLWELPTAPAHTVYTGVLYDAARAADWSGATLDRAARRVRTISALWGLVSASDAIPAYRLSMGTTLPAVGRLTSFWRHRLAESLDALAGDSLVVDCRSADYASVWKPADASTWVTVRVERELGGRRSVVSHMAKHTRGVLAGRLVAGKSTPATPAELADAAASMIGAHAAGPPVLDVSLSAAQDRKPRTLTVVVGG